MSNIKYCDIYDGEFDLWGNYVDSFADEFGFTFKDNINSDRVFVRARTWQVMCL